MTGQGELVTLYTSLKQSIHSATLPFPNTKLLSTLKANLLHAAIDSNNTITGTSFRFVVTT